MSIGPSRTQEGVIVFKSPPNNTEMLKIAPDGFYVRGVKVPLEDEQKEVVDAIIKWFLLMRNT